MINSIHRIRLRRLSVPLVEVRAAAHGVEEVRESILVEVVGSDGASGWGECVALAKPTYTGEWISGAWAVLTALVGPALLEGRDPGIVGHPMAVAAVRDALLDLELCQEQRSLAAHLGSAERVASRAVIGLQPDEEAAVAAVGSRLEDGHRSVKLKVVPGVAGRLVAHVRQRWPDIDLAADANGSFALDRDADELAVLDAAGLTYLEQPLAAHDLVGHAELRRRLQTPIALDESIDSDGALAAAVALGAVDLVNVKPARLGGVEATRSLLGEMAAHDVAGFCGGMYELGIGRATALAVAGSPTLVGQPCDLGPSRSYVERDIAAPFVLDPDGCIDVPDGQGIGRVPDQSRLDEVTVETVAFGPVTATSEAGWSIADMTGSAREIHGTDLAQSDAHSMWFLDATEPALVLGSTQPQQGSGIDIVRRRSGGGAVLVGRDTSTWVDVVIPRASPLWDDDVGRSMHWVGELWSRALIDLGVEAAVHRGPLRHSEWSRTICFAGLGPGEVVDGRGRKIVGIAQRRTRAGARFQTIVYHHDVVARVVDLLDLGVDAARATAELASTTTVVDVDPAALRRRLVAHLPPLG